MNQLKRVHVTFLIILTAGKEVFWVKMLPTNTHSVCICLAHSEGWLPFLPLAWVLRKQMETNSLRTVARKK